jgi:hypothetical protein
MVESVVRDKSLMAGSDIGIPSYDKPVELRSPSRTVIGKLTLQQQTKAPCSSAGNPDQLQG